MRSKLTFVLFLVFFGFGAASTPSAFAAPPDVCTLLTPAQISAVIGASVGPCQPIVAGKSVSWTEPGKPGDSLKRVIVTIISMQGYEMGKTPMNGITKSPLSGVGDEGYSMSMKTATTIHFKVGDVAYAVDVRSQGASPEQLIAMEKSLGQQIAAKH